MTPVLIILGIVSYVSLGLATLYIDRRYLTEPGKSDYHGPDPGLIVAFWPAAWFMVVLFFMIVLPLCGLKEGIIDKIVEKADAGAKEAARKRREEEEPPT